MNDYSSSVVNPPKQSAHQELIAEAAGSFAEHMADYGEPAKNYERASALVSLLLNKPITPYEIAIIKLAVKLSRIAETSDFRRAYIEAIACIALAGEFSGAGYVSTKRMAAALKPAMPGTRMDLFHPAPTVDLDIPETAEERTRIR